MSVAKLKIILSQNLRLPLPKKSFIRRKLARRLGWVAGLLAILALLGWFSNLAGVVTLPAHDPLSPVRDRMFMIARVTIVTPDYQPAAGAVVTLDDSQQVIADAQGVATFEHAMHDNHTLVVYHNNQHYRLPIHIHSPESGLVLGLSDETRAMGTGLILLGLLFWFGLGFRVFYAASGSGIAPRQKRFWSRPFAFSLFHPKFLSGALCSFVLLALLMLVFAGGEGLAMASPQYNTSLPVPTDLKVDEDDNNAILTWNGGPSTDSNPEGVGGYRISWGVAGQPLGNVALTQYRIIQLQPLVNGQKYEVQVQAVDMQGNLSSPSQTLGFTGTPARVNAMRAKMTGFFDDFNLAAGAVNELKWNTAWSYCSDPAYSSMFINNQFHVHNMVSASTCDRGQSLSRPRAAFDFNGRTGTISFDFDGEFRRDQWYLDLVPNFMDIGGQVNIEAGDAASNPANVLRFHQNEQIVEILWINDKGIETKLATTDYNPYRPLDDQGLQLVPNVRRHWELKISQNSAEVWINGQKIVATNQLKIPYSKAYVLWNEFSYNTPKSNEPYVLVHWDNFGFDGPASSIETHNYRTSGYGGFDYAELAKESVKREITIPDQVTGAKAQRLMFTLQMNHNWYEWSPNDRVTVNGQTFPIPKPSGVPIEQIGLVSEINPYSTIIDLPPGLLKTGVNELEFTMLSGGLTNVHIELDYPANAAPPYTPPDKVYPLVTIPTMPDVAPGASLYSLGETRVELAGTVDEEEAKKVYPVTGVVPVRFIAQNEIAMNATGKNPGLSRVELRLNQKPIYTVDLNSAPYFETVYNFDTTKYANGQYALDVVAYNKNGTASIPDYFAGNTRSGDFYPLQIGINNPTSGAARLPAAPVPKDRGDIPAPTPVPGFPQPKPAAIFGNPADNSDEPAPTPAVVAADNPVEAPVKATTPGVAGSSVKADLKALLPFLAGGLLVGLSCYLVTGALVGDRLRRKHGANSLGLGMLLGWPYFALRRPKTSSKSTIDD